MKVLGISIGTVVLWTSSYAFQRSTNCIFHGRGRVSSGTDAKVRGAVHPWPPTKRSDERLVAEKQRRCVRHDMAKASVEETKNLEGVSIVERFYDAWNRREMDEAVSYFTEDCIYEDLHYSDKFEGKAAIRKFFFRVADAVPSPISFVVDDIADASSVDGKIGVKWHLESDGTQLPFTRGFSFYTLNTQSGLISTCYDLVEPALFKPGDATLAVLSVVTKVLAEPVRAIPLFLWIIYMYVVFFSNGILPGADVLQLELRTWEEVRDLSLNHFLVAPLLNLPFSRYLHPMLEGIFNVILSWLALFAGFLSDDREKKRNLIPMLPLVVGMQFLTSALYLPYLVTRTSETRDRDRGEETICYKDDVSIATQFVGESRILGPFMAGVSSVSILWAFLGRPEFGNISERYASFIELLSIDRVGSSLVVDLVIFGLFQGWLIDDDMRRRGVNVDEGEMGFLRAVGKLVPVYGLALYLTLRPPLAPNGEKGNNADKNMQS